MTEIDYLKKENRYLRRIIKIMKSELKTYKGAFRKTEEFLKDYTNDFSLDEILSATENNQTLEETFGREEVQKRTENIKNNLPKKRSYRGSL